MKSEDKPVKISPLIAKILVSRGVAKENFAKFLNPRYDEFQHAPFLFPDMKKAVVRIKRAKTVGEKVTIYGDYDIDGMTATVILWESLRKFGLDVETYTPDRFREGYGLNIDAVEQIARTGAKLIITVDNGTLSFDEITRAKELGVDVIVTDHHSPHEDLPDAVAILNPKILSAKNPEMYDEKFLLKKDFRENKKYPFCDLCGAGVAFKLVQALQTELDGLPDGQEKWLLDLVALGTVCDVVGLVDENRADVKWGLEVLRKTRRPGLRALIATAGADISRVDARMLGFVLGPRLNASGRLETAEYALELLQLYDTPDDISRQNETNTRALELAEKLEKLNKERRKVQDEIFAEAAKQIEDQNTPVSVKITYFVHGTTVDNENKIASGWKDNELSAKGIQQGKDLARMVSAKDFDAIFCSDLSRAVESAKLNFPRAKIIQDKRLRECNYGDMNGSVDKKVVYEDHIENPFPNGESLREVESRVRDFLEFLAENFTDKKVAIIAHKAPQLAIEKITKNLTWEEALANDWRKIKNWQAGWEYEFIGENSRKSFTKNPVAIAVGDGWHEGVIGIVAAKILEKFERPAFVLSRGKTFAKGSGRSFGDFSCAAAIHFTDEIIERGGGHLAAGGLTVKNSRIEEWKNAVQKFYQQTVKNPEKQKEFLYPESDLILTDFANLTEELLDEIAKLEPFGQANSAPVFEFSSVAIFSRKTMGKNNEHVKYVFVDNDGRKFTAVSFGGSEKFCELPFDEETGVANHANIRVELAANEWNGRVAIEGKLIKMELVAAENELS